MDRTEALAWIDNAVAVLPPLYREVNRTQAMHKPGSAFTGELCVRAAAVFHERHATLAFPGGWHFARERLRAGDQDALEFALCFIEVRPYFHRSGYMYTALLKCLNSVSMPLGQRKRYERVKDAYQEFKRRWREQQGGSGR